MSSTTCIFFHAFSSIIFTIPAPPITWSAVLLLTSFLGMTGNPRGFHVALPTLVAIAQGTESTCGDSASS